MLLFVVILVTFQIVVVMLLFVVILVVHTSDRCGDVGRLEDCCYVAFFFNLSQSTMSSCDIIIK